MDKEDKLNELFSGYAPEMTTDEQFMQQLERNMDAIEKVVEYKRALRNRSRLAVSLGAATGFITGVVLTLLTSLLPDTGADMNFTLNILRLMNTELTPRLVALMSITGASVVMAVNIYTAIMARTPKDVS